MEIEFMHQTLQQYVSPQASTTFTEIYTTISDCYERRPDAAQQNLQAQLDGVKKTLTEARKATAINFVCFRKERSKADSEREKTRTPRDREKDSAPREVRQRDREKTRERTRDRDPDASGSERRRY